MGAASAAASARADTRTTRRSLNHTAPISRPTRPHLARRVPLSWGGVLATRACVHWNYCYLSCRMAACYTRLQFIGTTVTGCGMTACYEMGGGHKDACIQAHALCLLLSPFAAWAPVCEARLLVGVAEAAGVRRTARRDAALARVGGIAADHALEAARARRAGAVRSRGARNLGLARSPASIRWRFHRSPRCTAASALLQPLSSPSALGRRRARSTRASPASLRWRFPPLCAV